MSLTIQAFRPKSAVGSLGVILLIIAAQALAQGDRQPGSPALTPKAGAPIDLTGYWVSVVTEDWRFRMVTPPKGDYASLPLNAVGRKVADTWDPAKDEAEGNQCRWYGAAGLMRIPGRLHITWASDDTLRLDTDSGTQTRMFPFVVGTGSNGSAATKAAEPASASGGWQGSSAAQWEYAPGPTGQNPASFGGSLKVVTKNMRPGYIRKNGVPYSANAVLTEYYSRTQEPNGDSWLIVTSIVDDPQYLTQSFITSTHFKKQADAAGWNPSSCAAR